MKIFTLLSTAAMLGLLSAAPASALTTMDEQTCKNMSAKMDLNADGKFDAEESKGLIAKMDELKLKTKDGTTMSSEEFMENCKLGNLGNMDNQSN